MPTVEERVDRLEHIVEDFVRSVGIEFNKLYNAQMRTEAELREFKDEMRAFKDEMKGFKDEMREFKDEMGRFKDEMKEINREMNRKWGDMANKLGTITEDLVAPSLPRIIKEEFDLQAVDLMVRRKKRLKDGTTKEYDAIAVADGYTFINYTKSTLKSADIDAFINEIQGFRDFFPEYKDNKLIGVLASLYVDEGIIRHAENTGFLILSVGDQLMEVKNSKGFKPKEW